MRPYSESLMDQILAQLRWISVAQGYSINIKNVQRYDRIVLNTLDKPCIHLHKLREMKVRSGDSWDVTVDFLVRVFLDAPLVTDDRPLEAYESEVGADIERSVCVLEDTNADDFRATLEKIETSLFSTGEETETMEFGVAVLVSMGYRVDRADPSVPIEP